MGTLFSLSKSVTSIALDISEIALLLFGIVLTIGLIGEYAKSERWKRYVRTFEMFVIIGVAGELLADGGIFLFSSHLQTIADQEIADLTRKLGDAKTLAEGAAAASSTARTEADLAQQKADAAEDMAGRAVNKSNKANTAAGNALTRAQKAGEYADLLAKRLNRRMIDGKRFHELMEGKPTATAEILFENDDEAWSFALQLSTVLREVGWNVPPPKSVPVEKKYIAKLSDGSMLDDLRLTATLNGIALASNKLVMADVKGSTPETALMMALRVGLVGGWKISNGFICSQYVSLPDNLVVIMVGRHVPFIPPATP
jgi:hypothetical protein